jgi:hypothetical protein
MIEVIHVSAQEYYDGKTLADLIKRRKAFESHRADSYYAKKAGVQGVALATAFYQGCPECGQQSYYVVLSYNTLMYGVCRKCRSSEVNMSWYSTMTRVLQNAISTVFASAALALAEQRVIEEYAEMHYQDMRQEPHTLASLMSGLDITLNNGKRKRLNKREKLELYMGYKLVGRFIDLGVFQAS